MSLRKSSGQPADTGDVKRLALAEVRRTVKEVKTELAKSRQRSAGALKAAIPKHAALNVPMDEDVSRRQASPAAPALAEGRTEPALDRPPPAERVPPGGGQIQLLRTNPNSRGNLKCRAKATKS